MKKIVTSLIVCLSFINLTNAQIDARMFWYLDVSASHIAFVYAGDVWVVDKNGGTAQQLSSPNGQEKFPKFSPDGKTIAFTANYDGNWDVYTIPVTGGIPKRLTSHGGYDQVLDWHPDGNKILFASSRESGRQRFQQFFEISKDGGIAEKLALPYGTLASYSPDGSKLAFNFKSRINRTWKRYKGGWAPDIWTYDLNTNTSTNISNNISSDEYPMWADGKIYYASDNGPNQKYNIWKYDLSSGTNTQVTNFNDYDIHFASIGSEDLVFEAGGKLYLMNLDTEQPKEVKVKVITDQTYLAEKTVNVGKNLNRYDISPDGKRIIASARGDVYSIPAKEGVTRNFTKSGAANDRTPSWSPDGKKVAFWSDKSGEYQLNLYHVEKGTTSELTSYTSGFKYQLFWAPDSKKLAFVNQAMEMCYFDIETKKTTVFDKGLYLFHGALNNFSFSWSSDSEWITYSISNKNISRSIKLYNISTGVAQQVTSDFYSEYSPSFDPDNKYLFFLTDRKFSPIYSDVDNTFIYPNTTMVAAVPLRKEVESPLKPKSDEVEVKEEKKEEGDDKKGKKKGKGEEEEKEEKLTIDLAGFEQRMVLLPIDAGNYSSLQAVSGKLILWQHPNTGASDKNHPIKFYDLEEREVKTILPNVTDFELSADGKKIAASKKGGAIFIVDVAADQKMEEAVNTSDMVATIDPQAEWNQLFNEAWRLERDYFYDENMHGVDWEGVRKQYQPLIDQSVTRWDVNFVLGEMIGELNASHTYRGGGDTETTESKNVGYLGIDWEVANGYYRVKKIIRGAAWDAEVKSSLDMPGADIKVGDYILEVNGRSLDTSKEPYAAFEGLANKTVELTVNTTPSTSNSKKVLVQTLSSENRLRHLQWIEQNRKQVEEATQGRAGYIYVRSTGIDGQNELQRQFAGQFHKDALIIDERFNSGGQIPDRFIEMLNRKELVYWDVRDGQNWQWPQAANFGPKAMLINGWSGSGGDAFPDYFRKSGIGPLIGTRTWGGLIGISGAPSLIDGGSVTVPTFRMYDPDGTWFKEGHGVEPDIEVKENPGELAQGTDAQLMKAIEWINEELKNYQDMPQPPEKEKR